MGDLPSDAEEQIVALIKQHLGISFTLFQFSDLKGRDLLELLAQVVHVISTDHPEKLGVEKLEVTVERFSEFLRTLRFPFPVSPEEWDVRLGKGDKEMIHPALYFLLKDCQANRKKAYLAKYQEEIPVPPEIRVNEDVKVLMTSLREVREQFTAAYQENADLGNTNVNELRTQINDLEADKARLATRIATFKRKVERVKDLDTLLRWTSKVRQENEREAKLLDQGKRLEEEIRVLRIKKAATEERTKNLRSELEGRVRQLRLEVDGLKTAAVVSDASGEAKALMFSQQQVIAQSRRLEQKQRQLQDLRSASAQKEEELAEKQKTAAIEVPNPTQWSQYLKTLKVKNETYRKQKAEIEALNAQLASVTRAEVIVSAQAKVIDEEVDRKERKAGVNNFRKTKTRLEEVSAAKAEMDSLKGRTVEELSAMVSEIGRKTQERQAELKPVLAKLQEQRRLAAAVETRYLAARQRWQEARSEYDAVGVELREECRKLRADIDEHQSKYHKVVQQLGQLERLIARATQERRASETGNAVSKTITSYCDFFHKAQRTMKAQLKELKDQRKQVGESNDTNAKQLEAFQSLRRLLQKKKESQVTSAERKDAEARQHREEGRLRSENIRFDEFDKKRP